MQGFCSSCSFVSPQFFKHFAAYQKHRSYHYHHRHLFFSGSNISGTNRLPFAGQPGASGYAQWRIVVRYPWPRFCLVTSASAKPMALILHLPAVPIYLEQRWHQLWHSLFGFGSALLWCDPLTLGISFGINSFFGLSLTT